MTINLVNHIRTRVPTRLNVVWKRHIPYSGAVFIQTCPIEGLVPATNSIASPIILIIGLYKIRNITATEILNKKCTTAACLALILKFFDESRVVVIVVPMLAPMTSAHPNLKSSQLIHIIRARTTTALED